LTFAWTETAPPLPTVRALAAIELNSTGGPNVAEGVRTTAAKRPCAPEGMTMLARSLAPRRFPEASRLDTLVR